MLEHSDQFAQIASALAKAQGEFPDVEKNCTARISSKRTGQSFTYDYADLAAIRKAVAPALAKYSLALLHSVGNQLEQASASNPRDRDGAQPLKAIVRVQTELIHESGEWFRTPVLETVVDGGDVKEIGIACTYFRRYQLQALLGISPEDDTDADSGGQRKEAVRSPPPAQEANGARFTCRHGHKHTTADGAKSCQGDEAAPPSTGESNPPAGGDPCTAVRKAIETQDWKSALTGITVLPSGPEKERLKQQYQAARYPPKESRQ